MKKIILNKLLKKNFTSNQVTKFQKFLSSQNIILKKSNPFKFTFGKYKNIYLTLLSSTLIILVAFFIPMLKNMTSNKSKIAKINNSSKDFIKILEGEQIQEKSKIDEGLDLTNILEDVFKFEDLPEDTVRLSASTIEQLFDDINYTLEEVRKTKKVKPIRLSLLPNEIKQIENSKERKSLFIKIILPLILEENNRILLDRKRLFRILNKNKNSKKEKVCL